MTEHKPTDATMEATKDRKRRAEPAEPVGHNDIAEETASEEERGDEASTGDNSVEDESDFEMEIAMPDGQQSETKRPNRASKSNKDTAEDSAERLANKCAHCSARKVKTCSNNTCKRCCLRLGTACSVHSVKTETKAKDAAPVEAPKKTRTPVLKNEFRESNVMYYEETVTLFSVRDFFQAKKLSQALLNDQIRSKRAKTNGLATAAEDRAKRRVAQPELKASVLRALGPASKRRRGQAVAK
ncbi:hypothetical protein Poli38472_005670 [Pythium oligandrum]|uniref:Uncharacterized protein n=1 Tax=Pythium oligandrum TaxID=41045 RepID=A0A8K1CGP9_PYTOL|nr:hypothetical protein Poli38472_005670 [Pythium oligandrum]|eukprot:TMW63052.1 hypothetical protein Poli38472_005670 [Pythium oligandrum]